LHPEAFRFVASCLKKLPPRQTVLEYGGRNINGTTRVLLGDVDYTSVDIVPGPGVDVVADAAHYTPVNVPDTIICTEVLEHTGVWAEIVRNSAKVLGKSGVLILTCACEPRLPHSGVDGHPLWANETEYYHNIDPLELSVVVEDAGFPVFELEVDDVVGDIRLLARMAE
jgi:hypothetical protein